MGGTCSGRASSSVQRNRLAAKLFKSGAQFADPCLNASCVIVHHLDLGLGGRVQAQEP